MQIKRKKILFLHSFEKEFNKLPEKLDPLTKERKLHENFRFTDCNATLIRLLLKSKEQLNFQ